MCSQCCHFDDTTCYHVKSNNSLSHVSNGVSNGAHNYINNVHINGATFQYNQDLIQVSPSLPQTHLESFEYYQQEDNNHCPTPSNIYTPIADNTSPEEMLHALLREQNDEYCYPPYKNVAAGTPLSPMSMQSVDSFDTLSSPKLDDLISSPNSHTSAQYYVVNSSSLQDTYYQTFEDYHRTEQEGQFLLQLQYEFEQQQSVMNESIGSSQYDSMTSRSHSFQDRPSHPHPLHYQQRLGNNNGRRCDNSQHVTPHQHDNRSTNSSTSLVNTPHVFNDSEQVQPKRKRNTSRRTLPSQLICPTCSRKFTRPYNLKSHQRTHTKERPFICTRPGCTWTFARPHDLKRHDLLHSGIKKYVCSCGKPFARSDAFKRHQAVDKVCSLRLKGNYM
ncbi:hypothetical protein MFLAVUS_001653 [Mucor flavus]|uniref:C2H2-type domain-containing protein n=1 Tax=Mucor flavus TaxID=439312 RepID=A0ABP9YN36_9FUNG